MYLILMRMNRRHLEEIQWANPLWMGKSDWCIGKNQREVNISGKVMLKTCGLCLASPFAILYAIYSLLMGLKYRLATLNVHATESFGQMEKEYEVKENL